MPFILEIEYSFSFKGVLNFYHNNLSAEVHF